MAQTNFNSPGPRDAWFQIIQNGVITECATNGRAFIRALQRYLRATVPANSLTFDRSRITPSAHMAIDSKWGIMVSKALWVAIANLVASDQAPPELANRLASDARARVIGQASLQAAVLLLARIGRNVHLGEIHLGPAILPVWNTEPPMPPAGTEDELVCEVLPPDSPVAPPVEVTNVPPAPEPTPTPEEVATGVVSPTPTGQITRPVLETGGISWPVIGVSVGVVLVLSLLGYSLMKSPAAQNTHLRRPSRRRLATA